MVDFFFDTADDESADKTQNNEKWDRIGNENDWDNYIYEITEDFINDNDETIPFETFFSDPISYSSYSPNVRENAYIITKKINYSDCDNAGSFCGEEKIYALADSLKIIQKIGSAAIKISDNTIYSKKVIDQIDFSNDEDASSYSDMLELLDFYITILNQYNIIKTTFINTLGELDYDYLLFKESDEEIKKIVQKARKAKLKNLFFLIETGGQSFGVALPLQGER